MQTGKILQDINELESPAVFDSLIKYVGSRTREELKIILGLKRKAFGFLIDKTGRKADNIETEVEAFLAAAQSYRRHRPHSAKVLARIAAQRQDRKDRHPNAGRGIRGRIESDYEDITAYIEAGYTWPEICRELKTRDCKYKGLSLKVNTLRKTYARIKAEQEPPTETAAPEPPQEVTPPAYLPAIVQEPEPIPQRTPTRTEDVLAALETIPKEEAVFL